MRRLSRLLSEARALVEATDYSDEMGEYAHQRAKDGASKVTADELKSYLWDVLDDRGDDPMDIDRAAMGKIERDAKRIARDVTKLIKQGQYRR
jgi:hypothetical protein